MSTKKREAELPGFAYVIMNIVFRLLFFGVAYVIYTYGSTKHYNSLMNKVTQDWGLIYFGFWILNLASMVMNINSGRFRYESDVGPPDQQVFKVVGKDLYNKGEGDYVRLIDDNSNLGKFNRAQRAVFNYYEYLPGIFASAYCAGSVFPFPTFVLLCGIAVFRVIFSLGYASTAKGRTVGFVGSMQFQNALDGLHLFGSLKILGYI
jgi:hypothetical protein